ncbi:histidine kinase/DNA gyrase B/HSP90-like ATPase [Arcicella aurantiaca]|uniref:histidine kinase n=1 Tax=Arcicella aurantiaca TaxID=591202 RepID=A0A316EH59_9BACT|nr:HAMP domain-containing sensor histidine kinase [Arcicella aurantiaca]PWK29048.1 histidine kinase/DNA gyrase B/HSP90-like ATPase [Arcicella aurantiaca]
MLRFNRYEISLTIRVVLLLASITVAAFCIVMAKYSLLVFAILLLVFQIFNFVQFINKTNIELSQFIEAVRYRDFSLQFTEKNAPVSVRQLRRAFNQINSTFKQLSSEREEQYQYLQKILELVDTGILSYNQEGEVGWINESFKRMMNVPYLRNISSLEKRDVVVYQVIMNLENGDSQLVKINQKQVLLAKTTFLNEDVETNLIAFQNVNEAIEDTEAQAYQKLLRVMTHEIMNSVAPIASLAETIEKTLHHNGQANEKLNTENAQFDDIVLGISTIRKRSENLLKFADTYRQLAKVSITSFSDFFVHDLFEGVEILLENQIEQKNIEFDVVIKDFELTIEGDMVLVEQMLINLIINAIDAVKNQENPKIILSTYRGQDERPVIEVRDNGIGMSPDLMDKIFVPFFTSKPNGSGIGLSLSKQIMTLHKGTISVHSIEGEGTIFRLGF